MERSTIGLRRAFGAIALVTLARSVKLVRLAGLARPAALAGLALACGSAAAQVIFQTGFEAPKYSTGRLTGQDGWFQAGSGVTVQNTVAASGSQAVQAEASASDAGLFYRTANFDATGKSTTLLRLTTRFRASAAADSTIWEALGAQQADSTLCNISTRDGGTHFRLLSRDGFFGSLPVVRGTWQLVQLDLDFAQRICTAWVDGKALGFSAFGTATGFSNLDLGVTDFSSRGADRAWWDDVSITAIDPSTQVVEFYNSNLDHFFVTANAAEAAAIDSGSAGPGWRRTGSSFTKGGTTPVCRFYGSESPGPNSHFYTSDAAECAALKALQASTPATQKRWNFESNDFSTTPAVNGTCAAGLVPVYRAYNDGFTRGIDSNHRLTTSRPLIELVVARGWIDEGIVMCAPAP